MPAADATMWKRRQARLNAFVKDVGLKGVGPIPEDGVPGPTTRHRIEHCKFWLGWHAKHDRKDLWTGQFDQTLIHPYNWRYTSRATVRRGVQRRLSHNAAWARTHLQPGITTYDGVRVARCAVPILQWCREHGWHGVLVSGVRTKAYSQWLCMRMCGHPTCPGRCAGVFTNHVGVTPDHFAVDVSDYWTFRSVVARCPLKPHIFNALPNDPVHFSPTGR